MDYRGIKCPVCGKFFTEHDDIVVCPECGAPYHRACYEAEGHCIFTEKHRAGEAWQPPRVEPPEAPDPESEPKDKRCGNCGRMNAHSALFCNYCGHSLSGGPAQYNNTPPRYNPSAGQQPPVPPYSPFGPTENGQQNYNGYPPQPGMPMPFIVDPMGGYAKEEPIEEGVTAGEVAEVVQNNSAYYMAAFRSLKMFGRTRFHFCAFICSGGWFLYRKQYKLGAIITAIMFLLTMAGTYITIAFLSPALVEIFSQMGVDITTGITQANYLNAMLQLYEQSPVLLILPSALSMVRLGIMIFCGIKANKLYYRHCIATVRKVKASAPSEPKDVKANLQAKGGVNIPIAVCIFVCYLIVTYLPQFI